MNARATIELQYQEGLRFILKKTTQLQRGPRNAVKWPDRKIAAVMERKLHPPPRDVKHWRKKLPSVLTDLLKLGVHGAVVNAQGMRLKQMPEKQAEALAFIAGRGGRDNRSAGLVLSSDPDGALILAYCTTQVAKWRGGVRKTAERLESATPMLTAGTKREFALATPEFAPLLSPPSLPCQLDVSFPLLLEGGK